MELLLHLLNQRRLDVSFVSLSTITDSFLAQVRESDIDPGDLGDFLSLASQLVLLKSRLLLPSSDVAKPDDHTDDDRELVRRIQEYQAFKETARFLAEQLHQQLAWYSRPAIVSTERAPADPFEGIDLDQLRALACGVATLRSTAITPARDVFLTWPSLSECVDVLDARLVAGQGVSFAALVSATPAAEVVVGMFLAVLHLWKQARIDVAQEAPFADLNIRSC
jgi:segregation and condensation protein A